MSVGFESVNDEISNTLERTVTNRDSGVARDGWVLMGLTDSGITFPPLPFPSLG